MYVRLGSLLLCFCLLIGVAHADQDLVRLPGQGEIKQTAPHIEGLGTLVPGGGLLLSFDKDQSGEISPQELTTGITQAFQNADANEDGRITPLEQVQWSESLPTRDISLTNPARFDPNLDRRVNLDEFTEIVAAMAAIYADENTGIVRIMQLKAKKTRNVEPEPERNAPEQQPARSRAPGVAPSGGS